MLTTSTRLKQGCRLIFAKVVSKTWPKFQFLQQPESHVRNSVKWCPGSSLVVNSSSRQHHGVVVRPLGRVAPPLLRVVPEMAACGVLHNPLGETLPYGEGKIHLQAEHKPNKQSTVLTNVNKTSPSPANSWCETLGLLGNINSTYSSANYTDCLTFCPIIMHIFNVFC